MKKQAKLAMTLTALVGVGAVSMTYAYWNQTASIDNPFNTGAYSTTVIEDFSPTDGEDWEPGANITKEVTVENEGDYAVIVRAKLDENWYRDDENGDPVAFKTVEGEEDGDVYVVEQISKTDGLTGDDTGVDKSVVEKVINNTTQWIDGGDGWYYYYQTLAAGDTSSTWLESVTLDADADMGEYYTTYYVSGEEVDGEKTWYEIDVADTYEVPAYFSVDTDGKAVASTSDTDTVVVYSKVTHNLGENAGYAGADYVLTVTIESVQATEDAVAEVFGTVPEGVDADWTYVGDSADTTTEDTTTADET